MATPLTATARIVTRYTSNSFVHRYVTYVAYNLVLGVPQLVDRDGITTVLWTLAAQYLWDKVRAIHSTTQCPATATAALETRSGALWLPTAFMSLAGGGGQVGISTPAQQNTWVLRDTLFRKLRFIILEAVVQYNFHSATGYGLLPNLDLITDALNGVDVNANAPFRWMKSRGDAFLAASGAVAGFTLDFNDKLKRARFLA